MAQPVNLLRLERGRSGDQFSDAGFTPRAQNLVAFLTVIATGFSAAPVRVASALGLPRFGHVGHRGSPCGFPRGLVLSGATVDHGPQKVRALPPGATSVVQRSA
jgi:hypothetical protein